MSTPNYKSLKDQHSLQQLIFLDDKGFVTYNSHSSKQHHSTSHNYYELYQLSKYFYPQQDQQPIIVGIQTQSHITMIKGQLTSQGQQRIVVIKQKVTINTQQEQNNA